MIEQDSPSAYEEVIYPGLPFFQTHPSNLATVARLRGMRPASVYRCRVLELGCGDGGNLIPMAYALPESEFLGIDLGRKHIARGLEVVREMNLENITLRQQDLMLFPADAGEFDYIIAHGVYSWVPPEVRNQVLAICDRHLAPNGVAFVSYNCYPYGHLKDMARAMMLYRVRDIADPGERVAQARGVLEFLADAAAPGKDLYQAALHEQARRVRELPDQVLFHDDLESFSATFYFHEFAEHAARHDLRFVGEADFFRTQEIVSSPEVRDKLRELAGDDDVSREQYADFVKGRSFRQTLLCRRSVALRETPEPAEIREAHLSSPVEIVSEEKSLRSRSRVDFRGRREVVMTTDHPLTKAALACLGEAWPLEVAFRELIERAARLLASEGAGEIGDLKAETDATVNILFGWWRAGGLEINFYPLVTFSEVSEKPKASLYARLQAMEGPLVTSVRHASVKLDAEISRVFLYLLDGTRDREQLRADLTAAITDAQSASGGPPINLSPEMIDTNLRRFAKLGFLVA